MTNPIKGFRGRWTAAMRLRDNLFFKIALTLILLSGLCMPGSAWAAGPGCDSSVIIGGPCKTLGQTAMDCAGQNILACLYPLGQVTGQKWYIAGTDAIPDCMALRPPQILQFNGTQFSCATPYPICPPGEVFSYNGTQLSCGSPTTGSSTPTPAPRPTPCSCSTDPSCITEVQSNTICPGQQNGMIYTLQYVDCSGSVTKSFTDNTCSYTYTAPVTQTCKQGEMVNACDSNGQNCQTIPCPISSGGN